METVKCRHSYCIWSRGLHHPKRDQIRNTKTRKQLKQESVEVLKEKRTLRWYGEAVRMESERQQKLVLEARPERGRGKGGPRVEWEE
jgi:hypothetical protein